MKLLGYVSEHVQFSSVVTDILASEMAQAGFKVGDSVNITFSNGRKLCDVPFVDTIQGYDNEVIMFIFKGYEFVQIARMHASETLWAEASLHGGMTFEVTLNEAGKYLAK